MRALPTPEGLCRFKVPFPYVPPSPSAAIRSRPSDSPFSQKSGIRFANQPFRLLAYSPPLLSLLHPGLALTIM